MRAHEGQYHRRTIRLQGYDYRTAGAYFITICTHNREMLFDDHVLRAVAEQQWALSASIRAEVSLDSFVVMPNHVHGIVWITNVGAHGLGAQGLAPPRAGPHVLPRSLGAFVRGYKSAVTRDANALLCARGLPVWQRNFYEHIVRSEADLERIRHYIQTNPERWAVDRDNPCGIPDEQEKAFWSNMEDRSVWQDRAPSGER
ncbi:MAG: transposase [Chloroflexi bacterium]|nr:transposase [Chloroflexota bacterium]